MKKVTIQTKTGRVESYLVRQLAHDKPVAIGGKLFRGVIVAIEDAN